MEHGSTFLILGVTLLAAAVAAVVLSHRLGLGSVAGYLLAGIALGPSGFKLVGQVEEVRVFAELGVVFLMFVIGLELEPRRLWNMRGKLLKLGFSQVAGSIAAIAAIAWLLGFSLTLGLVAGMALALSSTALALKPLEERGGLHTQVGQATFSVLLFQDLAVIPMLATLAVLGGAGIATTVTWQGIAFPVAVIAATLVGGHYLMRPVFRLIARMRLREIFTAFALLLVLGIAWGFEAAGLSMALGTFLAGVLLAESEYRHEIEAAVDPFKGLLLGLFFISVGMSAEFALLVNEPLKIAGLIAGLFAIKGTLLWIIAAAVRLPASERPLFVLLLAQGGEFAFVLLGVAAQRDTVDAYSAQAITLAVALSMLATPFMLAIYDRFVVPHLPDDEAARAPDVPHAGEVIIAGLGRMGQVVARMLHGCGYSPTILDDDPDHVEQCRKFGFQVFYGDATRLDLMEAAGAATARLLIIALDDAPATSRLARTARTHFPQLQIIARARDMRHLFELRDIGVHAIERESFLAALALGESAVTAMSGDPIRAARAARTFAEHDDEVVARLYAVHQKEPDTHVLVSNELRDQLAATLVQDAAVPVIAIVDSESAATDTR
jgi:glutathione-regulated potassium-efflux system ancillary protein KefC